MAAGGQARYSATYQMLQEAYFMQPDSLRGVYHVEVVSTPDSDTYF